MGVLADVGCVVIGRNEGARLLRCLDSVAGTTRVVYVDSGSTDGSVEAARRRGVDVVELDPGRPFTAARGRNAGVERLLEREPSLHYVQFVDGDCEVVPGWLARARERLERDADLAVVCGRRRERRPEASVWNRIVDVEWDTPVGDVAACGGDSMMRLDAFRAAGGFDPTLIAGEEPDLCARMRDLGWRIARIDAEMTLHDVAMTRLSQWWRRSVRSGHAYAEHAHRRRAVRGPRRNPEHRIWLWGALVPALATLGAVPTLGTSLVLFGGYPVSAYRAYRAVRRRGRARRDAATYAVAITAAKFAELQGVVQFHRARLRGERTPRIEYK
jgi:GT2 family glycosyltransferase